MGFEIYMIIFGVILFVIGMIANSGGSPEDYQRTLDEINRQKQDSIDELKAINEEKIESTRQSKYRDLNLDGLITIGIYGSLTDTVETLKTQHDPLVRLVMVYLFLEQLSPEYKSDDGSDTLGNEASSLPSFSYKFFKKELSEEDWNHNFYIDEGKFDTPIHWDGLSPGIESLYKELNDEEKHNICAMLCSELTSSIDDDELIQRFIELARNELNDSGYLTDSAEATFSSIEL